MTFLTTLLVIAGILSIFASLSHLHSITRGRSNPLTGVLFIWTVTSFWAIVGYFIYTNTGIVSQLFDMVRSPDFKRSVGVIAGVITILEFIPYIYSILKGHTKPERATWFIWSVVTVIEFSSYYFSSEGGTAIWVSLSYMISASVIAALSVKYGVGGWNLLDRFIIIACGGVLLVWYFSGSAIITLGAVLLIDLLAALPTIRKTYYHPETEDRLAWVMSLSGNGLNLLAIPAFTFADAAYPIYLFLMVAVVTELVLRPRHRRHRHEHKLAEAGRV